MVLSIRGTIHVVFEPKVELLGVNGGVAIIGDLFPVEIVAGWQLQVCIDLLAH